MLRALFTVREKIMVVAGDPFSGVSKGTRRRYSCFSWKQFTLMHVRANLETFNTRRTCRKVYGDDKRRILVDSFLTKSKFGDKIDL